MSISQREFQIQGIGNGQAQRILDALCYWPAGERCPMPHLARVASNDGNGTGVCVSRRIYDLRKHCRKYGYDILNDTVKKDGQVHSFYRIVKRTDFATVEPSATGTPTP